MKNILITGGDSRFASELKKVKSKFKLIFCGKKKLDVLSSKSIRKNFLKYKPDYILHLAGLSRPMKIHEHWWNLEYMNLLRRKRPEMVKQ